MEDDEGEKYARNGGVFDRVQEVRRGAWPICHEPAAHEPTGHDEPKRTGKAVACSPGDAKKDRDEHDTHARVHDV